tara:strand:+ start:436 stop:912 length:477 start_codon:yes stop_codon:yes gene_type:complete
MNYFKQAILSLGGSLFKDTIGTAVASTYASNVSDTVKGIPIIGGFLDKSLSKAIVNMAMPSGNIKQTEMKDLPSADKIGQGYTVQSKRFGASGVPTGKTGFVQNALNNPKIKNQLIKMHQTTRLPQINSPRPNFGINLAAKPNPKLYKSKAESKTETV